MSQTDQTTPVDTKDERRRRRVGALARAFIEDRSKFSRDEHEHAWRLAEKTLEAIDAE